MVEYAAMKPIATDTHDFPSLRRNGCIYVDKTKYIHRLVSTIGSKLYFLSRPRRFEKSLTVSALKALFQARSVQASGRADIVASHVNGVYIFELKVGESVDKAFRQIREKGYATPYLASGLPIHFIGLSFDPATRQLVDCAVQEMGER